MHFRCVLRHNRTGGKKTIPWEHKSFTLTYQSTRLNLSVHVDIHTLITFIKINLPLESLELTNQPEARRWYKGYLCNKAVRCTDGHSYFLTIGFCQCILYTVHKAKVSSRTWTSCSSTARPQWVRVEASAWKKLLLFSSSAGYFQLCHLFPACLGFKQIDSHTFSSVRVGLAVQLVCAVENMQWVFFLITVFTTCNN